MPQSYSEKKKQAWLHQLRNTGQDKAFVIEDGEVKKVTMHNPHLVEDEGRWSLTDNYNGHMVSRFVKPPPSC